MKSEEIGVNSEYSVSFIVPIYNTKVEILRKGINSIRHQSPFTFEVLLIDDGSSQDLAQQYDTLIENEHEVKIYHIPNAGAANARNVGIEKAQGEYIIFIDADDYLPGNEAIIQMKKIMDERQLDFLIGAAREYTGEEIIALSKNEAQLITIRQQSINGSIEIGSPWAKIFRRSFLIENEVRFNPKLRRSHDRLFMMNAFERSKNFEIRNIYCYCLYTEDENSLSRSYNPKTAEYLSKFYEAMKDFVHNYHPGDNDYKSALRDLQTIVHRQCAQQIYFHPCNKDSFIKRYGEFRNLRRLLGNDKSNIVRFRGASMHLYSILLKLRMYLLLSICLEINKHIK